MKKFITVLIVVMIVGAIAAGAYFGYKKSSSIITSVQQAVSLPTGGEQSGGQTSQPSSALIPSENDTTAISYDQQKQNLSLLTDHQINNFWIASSTSVSSTWPSRVFYVSDKGEIIEIVGPAKEELVSASSYGTPRKVFQSVDGQKAAVLFQSGETALFDVKTRVWKDLGGGISSISFSPDGTKLALLKYSGNSANIYTTNLSSAKLSMSLISSLSLNDIEVSWPDKNRIFLIPKQSYNVAGQIWYLNVSNKTVNLFAEGQGIGAVFSYPFDYGIQFTAKNQINYSASITSKSGTKLADMYLNTISPKCFFSYDQKQLYCAAPYDNNKGRELVLPDDYFTGAAYFHDRIYKIDLSTSDISLLLDLPDNFIDASNLKEVRGQLFFINRLDGQLYVLKV